MSVVLFTCLQQLSIPRCTWKASNSGICLEQSKYYISRSLERAPSFVQRNRMHSTRGYEFNIRSPFNTRFGNCFSKVHQSVSKRRQLIAKLGLDAI